MINQCIYYLDLSCLITQYTLNRSRIGKKQHRSNYYVYDKITYAGDIRNLENVRKSKRIKIIKKDINDYKYLSKYIKGCDLVIHAAAESHQGAEAR